MPESTAARPAAAPIRAACDSSSPPIGQVIQSFPPSVHSRQRRQLAPPHRRQQRALGSGPASAPAEKARNGVSGKASKNALEAKLSSLALKLAKLPPLASPRQVDHPHHGRRTLDQNSISRRRDARFGFTPHREGVAAFLASASTFTEITVFTQPSLSCRRTDLGRREEVLRKLRTNGLWSRTVILQGPPHENPPPIAGWPSYGLLWIGQGTA